MKVSIVAPIGTSPPVVTEFLQYVEEVLRERVSDLTIIATQEEAVRAGVELVKEAVRDRYPHVRVHAVYLPFSDVDTQERSDEFMKIAGRVLKEQRERHRVDRLYVCIAGGRKDMCVALCLASQLLGASAVFHVVMPDVKAFNVNLERIRHEIEELARAEDKEGYYRQHRDKFDPVMYPSLNEYRVIRMPIVPCPKGYVREVAEVLMKGKVRASEVDAEVLRQLSALGYLKVGRRYAYATYEGRKLGEVLAELVGGRGRR